MQNTDVTGKKTHNGKEPIEGVYTNWKGETKPRKVKPIEVWFGESPWHPGFQWFLKAKDENNKIKDFALKSFDFTKP